MPNDSKTPEGAHITNFIKQRVEADLETRQVRPAPLGRQARQAGRARQRARSTPRRSARASRRSPTATCTSATRSPICLNFGLAQEYGGICHMRFDDTNPEKEEQEYVDSIIDAVKWLGFDFGAKRRVPLLRERLLRLHVRVRRVPDRARRRLRGLARRPRRCAQPRHASPEPGKDSPFRDRTPAENLALFREMRDGKHADGAHVLRAKIDMASPNINMRDPAIYRIKRATHHRTGDKWCIYPMYTYAHPIEDALENITHSHLHARVRGPAAVLRLAARASSPTDGLLQRPLPQQIEFSRLNLTLRGDEQAVPDPARRGEARGRLGRPAHAHAGRRAPPRLHARGLPAASPSASASPSPTPGSTTRCSRTACAST